jgi:hypothetical protein
LVVSVRLIQGHVLITLQSFVLGWVVGSQPLFWALFISFILGTAYSINVRAHISMSICGISYITGCLRVFSGVLLAAKFFSLLLKALE